MKVPKQFSANVVSTTCFLINHMHSFVLDGSIPYAALFISKDLFPIEPQIFDSIYFVHDVCPLITKLDLKSLKCVSLGYSCLKRLLVFFSYC